MFPLKKNEFKAWEKVKRVEKVEKGWPMAKLMKNM